MSNEEIKAFESVKDMFGDVTLKDIDEQSITIYGVAMLDVIRVLTIVEKQAKEIEKLKDEQEKEKNKDMSCDLTETRADNIDESTMLKQIKLKLQEKNIPIETLLAEFERLEDLEDDLTTVYLNGVYDGEKKVQDKIKAKIEEVKDGTFDAKIVLQSLLEKE